MCKGQPENQSQVMCKGHRLGRIVCPKGAVIREGRRFDSPQVGTLRRHDIVAVVSEHERRLLIITSTGLHGWVSSKTASGEPIVVIEQPHSSPLKEDTILKLCKMNSLNEDTWKTPLNEETKSQSQTMHYRGDYRKVHFFGSKEAKAEKMTKRYPNALERELISSCTGQWVPIDNLSPLGDKLRDAPGDLQNVPADMFEISELGVLFDISLSQYLDDEYGNGWYLGDLKEKDFKLSQTDMEGTEHTATLSHFLEDNDGNTYPQMLQWSNGGVWTRKRLEIEKLKNGHWHMFLHNGKCIPMSVPLQLQTSRGPNGELEIILRLDSGNTEKLWVFMEPDPQRPGLERLRWSNGQLWYPGETVADSENFLIVSPSDPSTSQDTHIEESLNMHPGSEIAARERKMRQHRARERQMNQHRSEIIARERIMRLHTSSQFRQNTSSQFFKKAGAPKLSSAESLLAHIQNRDREIQELLSPSSRIKLASLKVEEETRRREEEERRAALASAPLPPPSSWGSTAGIASGIGMALGALTGSATPIPEAPLPPPVATQAPAIVEDQSDLAVADFHRLNRQQKVEDHCFEQIVYDDEDCFDELGNLEEWVEYSL